MDPLQEALEELILAGSIEGMRGVVEAHPEVLGDDAIEIIAEMADDATDPLRSRLENVLAALMEWRALGLQTQLPDLDESLPSDPWDDLDQMIVESEDVDALKTLAAQSPYLLTDDAEQRLLEMEADSSAYTADRLFALVRFLRASRDGALEAAADCYARELTDVEQVATLAAEYLMTDGNGDPEFIRKHPVLLGRQAEQVLADFSTAFESSGADEAFRTSEKVATIERLREEGHGGR